MRGHRGAVAFTTIGATAIALIAVIVMARANADLSANDIVNLIRTPNGGLQPQAVADASGWAPLAVWLSATAPMTSRC